MKPCTRHVMIAVLGATVLWASALGAADKPKLVINELKATGVDANTVSTLGDVLCTHVANGHSEYNVMCNQDVKVILQNQNNAVLLGGCDDEKCLAEMGNMLKAELVLTGSIGAVGDKLVINLTLVNVAKGITLARGSWTADDKDDLLDGIRKAADALWKNVKPAAKPAAPAKK